MKSTFDTSMGSLDEVGKYMDGEHEGFRVTPGRPLIARRDGDSLTFLAHVEALALGVLLAYKPAHLYVMRIDSWFGPRWLYFSGKVLGALGVWKDKVTVPPFVRNRVLDERLFDGRTFREMHPSSAIHIECSSSEATNRGIADVDPYGAFLWFSGDSHAQGRGSVMVYLPVSSDDSGFYVSLSLGSSNWDFAVLKGISRTEVCHLEQRGNFPSSRIHA